MKLSIDEISDAELRTKLKQLDLLVYEHEPEHLALWHRGYQVGYADRGLSTYPNWRLTVHLSDPDLWLRLIEIALN